MSKNPGYHKGASYDVRFLDRQVGQAESDFTKSAYVCSSKVSDQKITQNNLTSYVNAP